MQRDDYLFRRMSRGEMMGIFSLGAGRRRISKPEHISSAKDDGGHRRSQRRAAGRRPGPAVVTAFVWIEFCRRRRPAPTTTTRSNFERRVASPIRCCDSYARPTSPALCGRARESVSSSCRSSCLCLRIKQHRSPVAVAEEAVVALWLCGCGDEIRYTGAQASRHRTLYSAASRSGLVPNTYSLLT